MTRASNVGDGSIQRANREEFKDTKNSQNAGELSGRKGEQFLLSLFIFFVPFESLVVPSGFSVASGECICSD
jgi:hypothetical protein